jgi:formate dehydrogenase major subunit
MQVLKEKGESPLPRFNPRNGVRTPQFGVQVERKWAREDYTPIANVNVPNQYHKGAH